jgi:hypothetical protein
VHGAAYHIRPARASDVEAVHVLVFADPEPHIRRLPVEDVRDLVRQGVLWLVCDDNDHVVASCYVKVPLTEAGIDPEPAEYGGAFVRIDCRRLGLGKVLAQIAIAHYFWDNDPESEEPLHLVAHVHLENPKPRSILKDLGFDHVGQVHVPDEVPGFEHMPRDPAGQITGDEFRFRPQARPALFRDVANLVRSGQLQAADGTMNELAFDINEDMNPDTLEELAAQLVER